MNDAKEGRNEGSLVETGVYITLINIFGPIYLMFCFSFQLQAAAAEEVKELRLKNALTINRATAL